MNGIQKLLNWLCRAGIAAAGLSMSAALLLSTPLRAQVLPTRDGADERLQTIDYRSDQIVVLESAPGYQLTVELAPDEQIRSVVVGDTAGWQVLTNQAGNRLFVQPLRTEHDTNMTVETNARSYSFDLVTARTADATIPYIVRFRYPEAQRPLPPPIAAPTPLMVTSTSYRISGAKALRPTRVSDDGVQTYIEWPTTAALPATYFVDALGKESLANGNIRDGRYVIDGVAPRLLFRVDKNSAKADRIIARPKRRAS